MTVEAELKKCDPKAEVFIFSVFANYKSKIYDILRWIKGNP
jgi:hypothetical protein